VSDLNRRQRPKRRVLSRDEIVQAADRILERDGYAALTIRRVAAVLGVKSASLYWHFHSKEELEDALADELLGRVAAHPRSRNWRENVRRGAVHMMRRLFEIRHASRLLGGRLLTGPNALRWTEATIKPFVEAGLAKRDVAYATHAIHVYIFGFAVFRSAPLSAMESCGKSKTEVLAATRKKFQELSPTQFPNIVLLAEALTDTDIEARFLFGLDCLLAGIARRAHAKRRRRIHSSR
jgi:TetR/AcrR family transcriptional regulator, tetracycline repressor protein